MAKIFIVTEGAYSDYRILQVFIDEDAANRFAARVNNGEDRYDSAYVEAYELRDAGWDPIQYEFRRSEVDYCGDSQLIYRTDGIDTEDEYGGRVSTKTHRSAVGWTITTSGPADAVPQAHSDAVARKRADIMGI